MRYRRHSKDHRESAAFFVSSAQIFVFCIKNRRVLQFPPNPVCVPDFVLLTLSPVDSVVMERQIALQYCWESYSKRVAIFFLVGVSPNPLGAHCLSGPPLFTIHCYTEITHFINLARISWGNHTRTCIHNFNSAWPYPNTSWCVHPLVLWFNFWVRNTFATPPFARKLL